MDIQEQEPCALWRTVGNLELRFDEFSSAAIWYVAALCCFTSVSLAADPSDSRAPSSRLISAVSDVSLGSTESSGPTTPISEADGTLSLDRLVEEVLARNPTVEEATARLRAANERPIQARALDDPKFTYMLGPDTLGSSQVDTGQNFEVSQSFPWPGKRRLREEAAGFDAESMRGGLQRVREQLAYETRVAFVELWVADRAIEINRRNAELLAEFERVAEDKYGAGLVSKQDALQAAVEREMLEHDGLVLEHSRNRAEARINALLDRETDAMLPASPLELGQAIPPPPLRALQDAATVRRPELAEAGAQIQSARRRADLARKEYYPDFSVTAGYNSFWQEDKLRPSIGFSINVPVQVARRRAGVAEAKAELSGAESRARAVRRNILREVGDSYEWVHEALDTIALYETRLVPAAEENLEAARSGYASGEVDFLALISAQKLLMDTTLRSRESRAAYHTGLASLSLAIGSSVSGELEAAE